jgi:hypothetical protein
VLTKQDDTTANHGTSAQLLLLFYSSSIKIASQSVAPAILRYLWIARVQLFFFALAPAAALVFSVLLQKTTLPLIEAITSPFLPYRRPSTDCPSWEFIVLFPPGRAFGELIKAPAKMATRPRRREYNDVCVHSQISETH